MSHKYDSLERLFEMSKRIGARNFERNVIWDNQIRLN